MRISAWVTAGPARVAVLLFLLFLVVPAAAWLTLTLTQGEPEVSLAGFAPREHPLRRVILITVDTLRGDALNPSNKKRISTPNLDRLAADGVQFTQAVVVAPWTLPSLASIMTGLSPKAHGTVGRQSILPENFHTLAEYMRDAGYYTAAFGSNPYLLPRSQLSQGFLEYDFFPKHVGKSPLTKLRKWRHPEEFEPNTSDLTELATSWLEANQEKDFFLWLHYFDPHVPYAPPSEFLPQREAPARIGTSFTKQHETLSGDFVPSLEERAWIEELYWAEVRYMDENLGRLIGHLKRLRLYQEALIILTSDHGEEFWEHARFGHGHSLYGEVLRVPLVIKLPGAKGGRKIPGWVSNAGLLPTVLDLCGVSLPSDSLSFSSLRDLWETNDPRKARPPIVATGLHYFEEQESVQFENLKYIRHVMSPREELYDLAADPEERFSLLPAFAGEVEKAKRILREHRLESERIRKIYGVRGTEEVELDEETKQRLRSLGYIR